MNNTRSYQQTRINKAWMMQFRETYKHDQVNSDCQLKRLFQWLNSYQNSPYSPPPEIESLIAKYLPKWTVRKAVDVVYKRMPSQFHLLNLIKSVREIIARPQLTDGTITRRLRELRDDDICPYKVVDSHRSIYEKELKKQPGQVAGKDNVCFHRTEVFG